MGRSYSAASSPPVSGTRLGAWPQARVATHHYASSDTTLAESTPPSPRNQPPPYRDEALTSPPYYQDDVFGRGKKHGELPKKTLVIRLCTSIFIAFLVCLIVAAVVGRIHDTQLGKKQDAHESAAQGSANGTRYTMMVEGASSRSTPTAITTAFAADHAAPAHPRIARPTGTTISTYSCPYVTTSATRVPHESKDAAASESICGLTAPVSKAQDGTEEESVMAVSELELSLHTVLQ
ncbi:hypothetical protein MY3296_000287 [Beauveria thailandica]